MHVLLPSGTLQKETTDSKYVSSNSGSKDFPDRQVRIAFCLTIYDISFGLEDKILTCHEQSSACCVHTCFELKSQRDVGYLHVIYHNAIIICKNMYSDVASPHIILKLFF